MNKVAETVVDRLNHFIRPPLVLRQSRVTNHLGLFVAFVRALKLLCGLTRFYATSERWRVKPTTSGTPPLRTGGLRTYHSWATYKILTREWSKRRDWRQTSYNKKVGEYFAHLYSHRATNTSKVPRDKENTCAWKRHPKNHGLAAASGSTNKWTDRCRKHATIMFLDPFLRQQATGVLSAGTHERLRRPLHRGEQGGSAIWPADRTIPEKCTELGRFPRRMQSV